jgi:predicted DNA binding CopG/RHH family protein
MERGDKTKLGKGGKRDTRVRGAPAAGRRPRGNSPLREAAVTLDAEDIALARLQAHLRRAETIQSPPRSTAPTARRITLRLRDALVLRLRERARREGMTPSEVVQRALENFLRSR